MKKEIGIMINEIAFPNLPLILRNAGYDFFILDCEHGAFDFAQAAAYAMTAKLCGIRMIVRIAQCLRKDITRYLDMGADGILLAMTSEPQQIEEAVRYAKYAPAGRRGISTMRAHTLYSPPPLKELMERANQNTQVFAQIETVRGVACAREIAAAAGVDGVLFGPNDYSCDAGVIGDDDAVCGAIQSVAAAAHSAGKKSGIITSVPRYRETAAQSGMAIFSVGSEIGLLSDGAKRLLGEVTEKI